VSLESIDSTHSGCLPEKESSTLTLQNMTEGVTLYPQESIDGVDSYIGEAIVSTAVIPVVNGITGAEISSRWYVYVYPKSNFSYTFLLFRWIFVLVFVFLECCLRTMILFLLN